MIASDALLCALRDAGLDPDIEQLATVLLRLRRSGYRLTPIPRDFGEQWTAKGDAFTRLVQRYKG